MLNLSRNRIKGELPEDRLYSLRALRSSGSARSLAHWIIGIAAAALLVMFLPWQQNIHGPGAVTALSPAHRPQTVPSLIAGRIMEWKIMEGDLVAAGDTLVVLGEVKEKYFDPRLLERIAQQLKAKENALQAKQEKVYALQRQVKAIRSNLTYKLDQAKAKLEAERTRFKNSENQYERSKMLYDAGNITLTKFQDAEYKFRNSEADLRYAQVELQQLQAEYADKLSKAESELNNTESEVFATDGEIAKLRNEQANLQFRNTLYHILAPQSGHVVRTLKAGVGEPISEGESLCTIMPNVDDLAVEMYVKAMDVPLIAIGRRVRIQFDGWPALQFSGWPSVSVGTFGGEVKVIDYTSSKEGSFRILVVPDRKDDPWPPQLRIGSGTKGWVMLDNVPVWFEIWRQLNGFPPSLYESPIPSGPEKKKPGKKEKSDE